MSANAGLFQTCKLSNIKSFSNSQFFTYDNVSVEFSKTRYSVLYDMYAKFQALYYETTNQSLLSPEQFQTKAPIVTIDRSKQNESVKTSTVHICLEMDLEEDIQAKTSAYCFILLDSIVTYTPLTRTVKKVL